MEQKGRILGDTANLESATKEDITTPQMTCFRGAKVCTKWLQGKSDDQLIQPDNKLELGTSYKLKLGPR